MNKKLRKTLSEKCKDMGLTDKVLDELAELGSQDLADDASDEDITAKADFLVPFAKATQGEITRKTRGKGKHNQTTQSNGEGDGEGDDGDDNDDVPDWFKKQITGYTKTLNDLKAENEALKMERTRAERNATIAAKAKELGIPDYLMKRVSFADDADVAKELEDYKQDLVNNKLMPKDAALEMGKTEDAMKADAKAWANSLPD